MEFKQLEAFVAAVDYNSFSEAAKKLYLTQPTISAHISSLEKELNTKLIIRTTKRMELTYRGQQFYECAVNILNMRNNIVQEFTGGTQKIISLGASTIPSSYILPDILGIFSKNNPDIIFNIVQSDSKKIIDRVLDGTIDFGLTGATSDSNDCIYLPFYQDELAIVTPATRYYRDLKHKGISLQTLLKEPLIMRENGSGTQKEIDSFLQMHRINTSELSVIARMNDLESIKHSIAGGLGISIMSTKSVRDLVKKGDLLQFQLNGSGHTRNLYIVYNKHRILRPHVSLMIQFIQNYYAPESND